MGVLKQIWPGNLLGPRDIRIKGLFFNSSEVYVLIN